MGLDNIYKKLNEKYGTLNKKELAQTMMKKSVDVGTAVVNILGATGIAGFKFHVPETELVRFENEITDHYVDTGSAIQDHIVQKPIVITLNGLVGDYFYSNNKIEDFLARIVPTLTLVKEFLPQITKTLGIKYGKDKLPKLKQVQVAGGPQAPIALEAHKNSFNLMDLFKLFQSLYKLKSAQTRAFLFFECLWKSRTLFSIETTWKRYDNMAVQSIQAKRDNNADITEFSITCKQITFANTLTLSADNQQNELSNRHAQEMSAVVDKGVENGTEVSLLDTFVGA
jgi:hypothetical protein